MMNNYNGMMTSGENRARVHIIRPSILCVEDEPSLLADLCEELNAAGYEAIGAPDVRSAWQALAQRTPDMIICDVNLPGPSGLDFLCEVRERGLLPGVPFVLLTALVERENILRGKWAGADDYLLKPVDYDVLLATISARIAQVERMRSEHNAHLTQRASQLRSHWIHVLDKISHCALVCDAQLHVRFANRAASALCSGESGALLQVDASGVLVLNQAVVSHPDVRQFLVGNQQMVRVDIASKRGAGSNWQVSLLALDERGQSPSVEGSFVVFLSDSGQRMLLNRAALARRFSLTPTELQVACLLTEGLNKQEMCEQMRVSSATMAYHLRNLFLKTDTNRQAELVAMLLAVAWNDIAVAAPELAAPSASATAKY